MDILDILLLAVALSMDAAAVGMTHGMTDPKMPLKRVLAIGGFFGAFQAVMPLIGYALTGLIAGAFLDVFEAASSWVSFILLALIGGKMIFDSLRESESGMSLPLPLKTLMLLSVATSLDALAVGVSFSLVDSPIILPSVVIGLTTFTISLVGVYMGKLLGESVGEKFGVLGGIVLICIGIKILLF